MAKTHRKSSPLPSASPKAWSFLDPAIVLGLILAVFIVYGQVSHFDLTHYDDPDYISKNVHVQEGLTTDSIRWAFTSAVVGHWGPVTLLSHILVYQFFHMDSGMHHLFNVVFHALAAVVLFLALRKATNATWPSAFVAAVFALHPLHVESVAWVAERKDVLSALFWFLTLYAYVRYVRQPDIRRYLVVVAVFCLGLMSKTMLVTLPFTLLLLDVWPFERFRFPKVVWEKLPLIALCAAASVVAYFTQRSVGAVSAAEPFTLRAANSLVSYLTYIGETIWPTRLAVFYAYPDSIPIWKTAAACVVLLAISGVAVFTWRTRPYIATGWFWYLGTLVPVIGLVQVGAQSHADHFTYIPMVGLTIVLAWGALDVVRRWPQTKLAIAAAGGLCCVVCMAMAATQAGYWQDGTTLFQHAMDVTEDNGWAKYNFALEHYTAGNELMNSGYRGQAIPHFEEALRVRPNWTEAHNNLGILLANSGRSAEAITHFETAVALNPNLSEAQRNLGYLLMKVPGKLPEAIVHLEAAQRLQPDPALGELIHRLEAGGKPDQPVSKP